MRFLSLIIFLSWSCCYAITSGYKIESNQSSSHDVTERHQAFREGLTQVVHEACQTSELNPEQTSTLKASLKKPSAFVERFSYRGSPASVFGQTTYVLTITYNKPAVDRLLKSLHCYPHEQHRQQPRLLIKTAPSSSSTHDQLNDTDAIVQRLSDLKQRLNDSGLFATVTIDDSSIKYNQTPGLLPVTDFNFDHENHDYCLQLTLHQPVESDKLQMQWQLIGDQGSLTQGEYDDDPNLITDAIKPHVLGLQPQPSALPSDTLQPHEIQLVIQGVLTSQDFRRVQRKLATVLMDQDILSQSLSSAALTIKAKPDCSGLQLVAKLKKSGLIKPGSLQTSQTDGFWQIAFEFKQGE